MWRAMVTYSNGFDNHGMVVRALVGASMEVLPPRTSNTTLSANYFIENEMISQLERYFLKINFFGLLYQLGL